MTSASNGRSYHYDAVGNVTERHHNSVIEATFDYTSFDKPHTIAANGWRAEIAYGVNRSRYLRKDINDSTGERKITHYLGSVEYIYENGSTTAKRYLGNLVIHIENNSDSRQRWDFNFLLKDHIGSTHTIANRFGNDINRMSFNAWGQRRHAPSLNDINNYSIIPIGDVWTNNGLGIRSSIEQSTTRGFTGHEHFDQVGIIHMNGRIYDPTIGRFLQADPIIQDPYNTQSLNRYSYVMNNPLSFSDPTGYFRLKKGGYETLLKVAVSIAITVVTSGAASGLITSKAFAVVVAGGFASGAVLAGNLKGAIKGAIQAAATFGIGHGKGGKALFGKTGTAVSHAVVGGISAEIDGGKFGHGFISSILTSGADSAGLLDFKKTFFRIVANAIVAGTISEITGGKFANGAMSAAFRVAFNESVKYNSSRHSSYPKPNDPDLDELSFVKSIAGEFDANSSIEQCAFICLDVDTKGNLEFSLSEIHTDNSHFGCDTSSLSCQAGSTIVSDIHNHPAPGLYTATADDVRLNSVLVEGNSYRPKPNGFSQADLGASVFDKRNVWLVPSGSNKILYFDNNSRYPLHLEFNQ